MSNPKFSWIFRGFKITSSSTLLKNRQCFHESSYVTLTLVVAVSRV